MSEYTGTFTVLNNTGATITSVVVTHYTTDYGPNTFRAASLAESAASSPTPLKASTARRQKRSTNRCACVATLSSRCWCW